MAAHFPPSDETRIIDVFGPPAYNNLDEPRPLTNDPGCLIGFTVAFLSVSWIFVCIRLWVRLRVLRNQGWDDLFVGLYLICTTIASICFLVSIKYGTGQHFVYITVGDVRQWLRLFYGLTASINLAAAFIKLSLLFQFLRIFDKGTWPHWASRIGIALVSIWGFVFAILSFFPCSNVVDAWNIFAENPKCWGFGSPDPDLFTATFVAHNVLNTIFDVYITVIPFQLYFRPGVTQKTRIGLLVLLLMAVTVILLSTWRIQDTIYHKTGWYPTHDPTWYGPKSIFLIVLEVQIASICASVPIFWPILSAHLGAIFVKHEFTVDYEQRDSDDAYAMRNMVPFNWDDEAAVKGMDRTTSRDNLNVAGAYAKADRAKESR